MEDNEFKSVNGESGSCCFASCESEFELHDTAPLFCHFFQVL